MEVLFTLLAERYERGSVLLSSEHQSERTINSEETAVFHVVAGNSNCRKSSGSLRDYSAFGSPPYTLPNLLFLGDNTSSANANVTLGNISLSAVPEPCSLIFVALSFAGAGFVTRRRTGTHQP